MKLTTEKLDVVKSQEFETVQYGVDASNLPLLFQLLRTNLYSDLHGSIIRELVSNVIDSHTEANKPNALGEVEWVPSNRILGVDCQLIVRDYGVGLSPERMKNIYGNYLSSTKRDGNSQIGGFGLGSKAPFAYTDSFSVQTVFDSVKYRYLCYIDETQLGAISLLTKEETKEENMTEIIIPIKDEHKDRQLFQAAIDGQLSYFRTIKYKGFVAPNPVILFENEHCIVKKTAPFSSMHIVLGNVAYQIDFNALGFDTYKMNEAGYSTCGVGLKFDIGELQPTMSRESLYWNQATKDKVLDKIAKAKKDVKKEIEKEVSAERNYAKWYANVTAGKTASFPNQFTFADLKKTADYTTSDGKKLKIQHRATDWFAGHNLRKVTTFTGWSRRKSANPDYSTSTPTTDDLSTLPWYQLERNLSAATCLHLFQKHPHGFIAISHLGKPDDKELLPYYEETKKWVATLDSYDAIAVPDDAPESANDEHAKAYRELVRLRKLEGKFTAKLMRIDHNTHSKVEENFIYRMYEAKFSDLDKCTVIYGFQDEHKKLARTLAMLLQSEDMKERFDGKWDNVKNAEVNPSLIVLKIGQNYEKHFFAMPNAHHVDEVLALDTPLNEPLGSIATALRIKPFIHEYHILDYFDKINAEMSNRYKELHKFVEKYSVVQTFIKDDLKEELLILCKDNLNNEMESEWGKIKAYLDDAVLLKTVNFEMYSQEHTGGYHDRSGEGTTSSYLSKWVKQSKKAIQEYLDHKGKERDGGPMVAKTEEPALANMSLETVLNAITNKVTGEEEEVDEEAEVEVIS